MSKVICDVCGTSYPDTATQCPICGCVRTASAQSVISGSPEGAAKNEGYTYVKGGRFSKSDVRKRNSANGTAPAVKASESRENRVDRQSKPQKDGKGLVIAVIVLALLIISLVLYIGVRFFVINKQEPAGNTDTQVTEATEATEDLTVPCEKVYFKVESVELTKVGAEEKIIVYIEPEGCTDVLADVTCDNPEIATATLNENIVTVTAVANGETTIRIKCGDLTAACKVVCKIEEDKELTLRTGSLVFNKKGEKADIYPDDILRTDIEWTSDDTSVATVVDGTVTAVAEGDTVIRAKYKDQEVTCSVKCDFTKQEESNKPDSDDAVVNGTGGVTEDGAPENNTSTNGDYYLTSRYISGVTTDVTLYTNGAPGSNVGYLKLTGSNGTVSGVTWSSNDQSVCTVIDGTVTAVGSGTTKVVATYNGKTYSCIIRVE